MGNHAKLQQALPVLQATLAKVEGALKQQGDHPPALRTEVKDLRHDLDLLVRGNDIHNMHYAGRVESAILERLTAICRKLKIAEPKVSLPVFQPKAMETKPMNDQKTRPPDPGSS